MYRNILVPIDLSHPEVCARVMEVAQGIQRANGGSASVISIHPDVRDLRGRPPPAYRRKLINFLARHGGADQVAMVYETEGSVSRSIRSAANRIGADLIVMGAREPNTIDTMISPEAAHVLVHTPCSVLLVR
jgi:nucleotide-binding universal stress UspA family protein